MSKSRKNKIVCVVLLLLYGCIIYACEITPNLLSIFFV